MGDATHQRSDGFHLLGLQELGLQPFLLCLSKLALGDVACQPENANHFPVLVDLRDGFVLQPAILTGHFVSYSVHPGDGLFLRHEFFGGLNDCRKVVWMHDAFPQPRVFAELLCTIAGDRLDTIAHHLDAAPKGFVLHGLQIDDVVDAFHQEAIPGLAAAQGFLGLPALGNVFETAFEADDPALVIPYGPGIVLSPDDLAVETPQPNLEITHHTFVIHHSLPFPPILRICIQVLGVCRQKRLPARKTQHLHQGEVGVQDPAVRSDPVETYRHAIEQGAVTSLGVVPVDVPPGGFQDGPDRRAQRCGVLQDIRGAPIGAASRSPVRAAGAVRGRPKHHRALRPLLLHGLQHILKATPAEALLHHNEVETTLSQGLSEADFVKHSLDTKARELSNEFVGECGSVPEVTIQYEKYRLIHEPGSSCWSIDANGTKPQADYFLISAIRINFVE